jgi:hypothetical protein
MMMNNYSQSDVINAFRDLNKRLSEFDMHIKPWGRLAVVLDSDPYSNYVLNNVEDIKVIEGFVSGLEYQEKAKALKEPDDENS